LIAERDENTCRMPFTPSEAVALGRQLEEFERPKAQARKTAGKNQHSEPKRNLRQASNDRSGKTNAIVGEAVGMSERTYEKAKAVAAAAEEEPEVFGPIAEEMDRTGKVSPAYDKIVEIKGEKRPVSEEPKPAPSKKSVAVARANDAIDCLMRIPANDPERKRGLQIVTDWIKHNK
jgi:hypothetical protein